MKKKKKFERECERTFFVCEHARDDDEEINKKKTKC